MADPVAALLERFQVGDTILVIDHKGTRFKGTLQKNRPDVDGDDVVIRRESLGQITRVPRARVRDIQPG